MASDDARRLEKKRSSLRSWRERKGSRGSKLGQREFLGMAFVGIILLAILGSVFMGSEERASEPEPPQEEAPPPTTPPAQEKPKTAPPAASLPAPSVKLESPRNTTYNTSTPPIDFVVAGSSLDTVLLNVDGGKNMTVPHDGSLAAVKEAVAYEVLNESFEYKSWLGNWSEPSSGYTASIDTQSYYGEHSLKVSTMKTSKGWSWIHREMRVMPGVRYEIEASMKGENVDGLHIAVDGYDNSKGEWSRLTNIGAKKGTFDWMEASKSINVPESVDKIRINLNHGWSLDGTNPAISWFDGIQVSPLTMVQEVGGKSVVLLKSLQDGPHNISIFANNSAGNASSGAIYFTVNATKKETQRIAGLRETVTRDDFEVTVSKTSRLEGIKVYPSRYMRERYKNIKQVTALTLKVKNIGKEKKAFKLNPNAVLVDNQGNQYEMQVYAHMRDNEGRDPQIEQTDLYPGVTREGVIYFEPHVSMAAQKVTLYLYINGEKYEFAFNPYH